MANVNLVKERYIWRLPVRIYHWINAILVSILFLTGLYFASPLFSAPQGGEATWYHGMAWLRYIHLSSAYLFFANFIFRMYWALFGGDKYARFGGFKPWKFKWWGKPFKEQMASYLFLTSKEPHYMGHNPVAAIMYFIFVLCGSIIMIITGFALYSENNPGGFLAVLFGWVIPLVGSSYNLHSIHHLTAWLFPVFFITHIYAVVRHDIVDRTSVTSSMITGYKVELEE